MRLIQATIAVFLLLTFPSTLHADLRTGLVGWWKLDEGSGTTAIDWSGNGNTGTLVNSPAYMGAKDCPRSKCLNFNNNGYITVPNSSSITLAGAMTITAWVYVNSYSGYVSIIGKTNSNVPANYDYYLMQTTGKPRFLRGDSSGAVQGTNLNSLDGAIAPVLSKWQFVAVTHDGCNSGTVTHYLNGAVNGSGALSFTNSCAGASGMRIGSRSDGGTQMNGRMDDVRIYNRALSATEIMDLYNDGIVLRNAKIANAQLNK